MGCDAQAGEPYRGEPLLTMSGSVELALEVEDQEALIPTLAFRGDDDTVHLVDADVEGEFPAEFTLNVYEPPPDASVYALDEEYGPGPRIGLGYIGAVTPDTPRTFNLSDNQGGSSGCWHDESTGMQVCETTQVWCTRDGSSCYTEITLCPDHENAPSQCTVTSEGDPSLKLGFGQRFAGLSENYIVLWLDAPAPPHSYIAYAVGERDRGLAQGYHLFSITDAAESDEREAEADACRDEADDLAVQRTNERFGTSYTEEELFQLCDLVEDYESCMAGDIPAAFELAQNNARIELDCPNDDTIIRKIINPASERISVRIGPDLKVF
jgi:hypothetical protein